MCKERSFKLISELASDFGLEVIIQRYAYDGFEPGLYVVSAHALAEEYLRGGKPTLYLSADPAPSRRPDIGFVPHPNSMWVEFGNESDDAIEVSSMMLNGLSKTSTAAPAYRAFRKRLAALCHPRVRSSKNTVLNMFWEPEVKGRTFYTNWQNPLAIVRPDE